ncbi:MAG TPA: hypothetical protein HPP83_00385 [Candidatus Hydrogenedentes bacterium]|nr:hypothetical protein [Candidatus Hydrogenedentota bacterium]
MRNERVQKNYVDYGFGFPVVFGKVRMVKVEGEWAPDIDYGLAEKCVIQAIPNKPGPLTGNQVRFIRLHFNMTLTRFGERFGVSHVAVKKWEDKGEDRTGMRWAIEKDLRLFVLKQVNVDANDFVKLYDGLEQKLPPDPYIIRFRSGSGSKPAEPVWIAA